MLNSVKLLYIVLIYILFILYFFKKAFVFLVFHIEMCVSGESLQ